MSSKLESLIKDLRNALGKFEQVMQKEENEYIRDSAIKRFEFTYELAWKTLRAYLKEKGVRVYTPRDTIREAFQAGLIDNNPNWMRMVDTRNATSHIYNEAMAEEVYKTLPVYLPLIKSLVGKLG